MTTSTGVGRGWRVVGAMGSGLLAMVAGQALGQTAAAVLTPPVGNVAYLTTHAAGTQNYVCLPSTTDGMPTTTWTFLGPQATLSAEFGARVQQVVTHFLSPVPVVAPTAKAACTLSPDGTKLYCPTWQSSFDSSAVWGTVLAKVTAGSDASCPTTGSIPCLLLEAVANRAGESGEHGLLSRATYVQRLRTVGGSAPAAACTVGQQVLVPYTAEYVFWGEAVGRWRDRSSGTRAEAGLWRVGDLASAWTG